MCNVVKNISIDKAFHRNCLFLIRILTPLQENTRYSLSMQLCFSITAKNVLNKCGIEHRIEKNTNILKLNVLMFLETCIAFLKLKDMI